MRAGNAIDHEGCGWARSRTTGLAGPKQFALAGDVRHQAPDRLADVRHIKIDIGIDVASGEVAGVCTTWLAPLNDGLEQMVFDAVEMDIEAVTLRHAERDDATPRSAAFHNDGRRLTVELGPGRRAAELLEIAIAYRCTPRRGLYVNRPDAAYPQRRTEIWTQGQDEDSRHWYPCHDFPNQKATSEVVATVPAAFTTVSNGRLMSVEEAADGRRRWHWKQDQPHVTYLITLAAGDYTTIEDEADGVPISYLVPPGREDDARRGLGTTPAMVRFFNRVIGYPYPWDKYAQVTVGDFIFGGMENTSATTLTDWALLDERASLDTSMDPLVAHELAHQWFGNLLTCSEWAHGWLNEGFATYFEALWTEEHLGKDEFRWEMQTNADLYKGEDKSHYRRPLVQKTYNEPIDLFDRHLYEKGSLVLHMLRFVLGDEQWWKAINHYVTRHAFRTVVSFDLHRAIEEATGRNLEWFFDQWVYGSGHPELKVSYEWDARLRLARLTIKQTQTVDERTPLFRMPLEIDFYQRDGTTIRRRIELSHAEETFSLPLDEEPAAAVVDPDNWLLCEGEFEKSRDQLEFILDHAPQATVRGQAVEALARLGSPAAIARVERVLREDGFWGVQARAAAALGRLKGDAARDALIRCLDVEHPKARRAVVTALGAIRDESAAAALQAVAELGDASYFVEAAAVAALGATRTPRAQQVLPPLLERQSYRDVIRAGVFTGLAAANDQAALPLILEWTVYGRPQPAREAAVRALGSLGKRDGIVRDAVVDRLIELLADPWLRVRLEAATALGKLGERRAISALQDQAARELDGRGVRTMRESVSAIGEGTANSEVSALRQEVDDLTRDNRQLRDRLDRLEARFDADATLPTGIDATPPSPEKRPRSGKAKSAPSKKK